MLNQYLEAGKIVGTHGVRGEVKIQPWANSPEFLCAFATLYIENAPIRVISARVHKACIIALFDGINDIDGAALLKNKTVFIDRNDANLKDGEHFLTDLIGLSAVDVQTGEILGRITEILPLNPNNVYVIKGTREILVPAVPEFVKEINVEAGRVTFSLLEGM